MNGSRIADEFLAEEMGVDYDEHTTDSNLLTKEDVLISEAMKRFGYQWLTNLSAFQNFSRGINVYINFYYHDLNTNELKETPLFLLDKDELKNNKLTRKQQFENALNHIKIQKVFPNTIMDYFYYTDNRTKIPDEFLKKKKNSNQKQLLLF